MGVKEVAEKQILKMNQIINRLNEAQDLLISLKTPALDNQNELMEDVLIGVPTRFAGSGYFSEEGSCRWQTVQLENDLGITDIQPKIRELLQQSIEKRILDLEKELREIIYYKGDYHA